MQSCLYMPSIEVKAILQRVQIVNHQPNARKPFARSVQKDCKRVRGRNIAFLA